MRILAVSVLLGVAAACSSPPEERAGSSASTIVFGSPDTTHQAVMFLVDTQTKTRCTATLIDVRGGWGFVLTAAHCFGSGAPAEAFELHQGDTENAPGAAIYMLNNRMLHPDFNPATLENDFAVARFGVTKATPKFIGVLVPDQIEVGTPVKIAGYGMTERSPFEGHVRNIADNTLTDVDENSLAYVESAPKLGGACSGDSGGPVLVTVDGALRIVGVTSKADPNCGYSGEAGRVSAVYESFILPYVNQTIATGCDDPRPTTKCSAGWRCCGASDGWSCGVCE